MDIFQQVVSELWLRFIGLIKGRKDQEWNKKIKDGRRT